MKKVIIKTDEIVSHKDTHENNYYGVYNRARPAKAFISASNGTYKVFATEGVTFANVYGYSETLLPELIFKLITNGGWEVFEFNTPQELFKWLSE